ncbi:MAG: TIR domain-containing protein [Chloroflexi bacterium]|nr:TIR domain-containing protein [Chloroflexota bacterium]
MTDTNNGNRATSLFISYSRKDKLFVRKLNDALDAAGINAWVDWEGIPLSSDWMAEITRAIESADSFLFVISPDSLASKVCTEELELGLKLNKKLIPILYRDPVKGSQMHPKLGATNWVYMRPKKDDFKTTVPKLIEAIQTDLGWVQQHTRLLQRATEWDQKNRNNSYLLQGSDLDEGEKWMVESAAGEHRNVLPLQAEYINTSRKIAIKRQRSLMTGIALAFVVSVLLGIYAFFQRGVAVEKEAQAKSSEMTAIANEHIAATQKAIAEDNAQLAAKKENEAKSQRSAAQAKIYEERPGELETSTLLALDSWARLHSQQAEDILRNNISLMPQPIAQVRHTGSVWNIHPSTDGTLLVTSSEDGSACVWTMQDAALKYCVKHEGGDVQDALLTIDNSLLVTAGVDGAVRLWNGADGAPAEVFNFNSKVWDIDLSADGKWAAAGREDGSMSLINLQSRKEALSFNLSAGEIFTVTFDPTSKWLAIGSSEGNVTLWRVNTGVSFSGPRHSSEVYSVAFSQDGNWLVSAGADSTARSAKTVSGGQKYLLQHGDWVEDIAFSPDGSWFATASDDNLVHVWDTETGVEKFRMPHGGFVLKVEISPDGQWIASTGFDKTVRVWNAASGSLLKEISLNEIGSALAFTPDGSRLITGDRSGAVNIWDISELNARVGYLVFPELVRKAKFNTTGEWTMFNSDDKSVWMIPTSELKSVHNGTEGTRVLTLNNISSQFKLSPDSKWIVISETYGKQAILYNLENKTSFVLPLNSDVTGLAFSADSKQAATTYEKGNTVILWDVNTGQKMEEIPFEETAFTISYDPVDAILAIGFQNKTVLWDIAAKKEIRSLEQIGEIRSLTYNRDGSWLATTSSDGSVYLWQMQSGDTSGPKYRLQQGGNVTSLDFSSNNQLLASGGGNGFAYLWDLATGEELARLPHNTSVTSVSFSNDGSLLMTVARKTVQVWDITVIKPIKTENIVENACSRLSENMSENNWKYFFNNEPYQQACPNLPIGK